MKKNITFATILLLLALVFSGCEKKKSEWTIFYNYSVDDIVGDYHYSNVSNAFEYIVEGSTVHICEDAFVMISKLTETSVQITLKCPDEGYNQTFIGTPFNNNDDFKIYLEAPLYEFNAIVYTNEKGEIRLHGNGRKIIGSTGGPHSQPLFDNWYYDVVKD